MKSWATMCLIGNRACLCCNHAYAGVCQALTDAVPSALLVFKLPLSLAQPVHTYSVCPRLTLTSSSFLLSLMSSSITLQSSFSFLKGWKAMKVQPDVRHVSPAWQPRKDGDRVNGLDSLSAASFGLELGGNTKLLLVIFKGSSFVPLQAIHGSNRCWDSDSCTICIHTANRTSSLSSQSLSLRRGLVRSRKSVSYLLR